MAHDVSLCCFLSSTNSYMICIIFDQVMQSISALISPAFSLEHFKLKCCPFKFSHLLIATSLMLLNLWLHARGFKHFGHECLPSGDLVRDAGTLDGSLRKHNLKIVCSGRDPFERENWEWGAVSL